MAMRILFLAPQPFYQERGTPIAVLLLLRALSERGDQIDLLTFPEGDDVSLPGLSIHRVAPWPAIVDVRPGFSWRKVYCDTFLAPESLRLARRLRPDVIHATEEGVFLAQALQKILGVPFVYDMDSSMSDQIADRFPGLRPLRSLLEWFEGGAIRAARVVVPMCEALAGTARRFGAKDIVVLEDVSLLGTQGPSGGPAAPDSEPGAPEPVVSAPPGGDSGSALVAPVLRFRDDSRLADGKIVLYVGNLEPYQGIDLLLDAFRRVADAVPLARLVVVGGVPGHVAAYERRADELGLNGRVVFAGPQPVGHLGALLVQADLLVSPRIRGENTPMKLYTYLDSGVAVLATDLPTHTQVVSAAEAGLAAAEPFEFAGEMIALLEDDARRARLAAAARNLIRREHSYESFRAKVHELYARLESEIRPGRRAAGTNPEGPQRERGGPPQHG